MKKRELAQFICRKDSNLGYRGTVSWVALWDIAHLGYFRMAEYALAHTGKIFIDPFARGLCCAACDSDAGDPIQEAIAEEIYQHQPDYWKNLASEIVRFIEHGTA